MDLILMRRSHLNLNFETGSILFNQQSTPALLDPLSGTMKLNAAILLFVIGLASAAPAPQAAPGTEQQQATENGGEQEQEDKPAKPPVETLQEITALIAGSGIPNEEVVSTNRRIAGAMNIYF